MVRALRVAFADFSAAPWQGFEKSERGPNNSSLFQPLAAVVVVAVQVLFRTEKEKPVHIVYWFFLVRIRGLEQGGGAQRSELDYLIYNDPLAYAELILNGEPEEYLRNVAGSHGLED